MRLFIGIQIPDEIKEHIAAYIHPLQKTSKGWEKVHDFHLTLLFIGEVSEEISLSIIKSRLKSLSFEPFWLELGRLEFFNRRILYMSFKPSEQLLALKAKVDEAFPEWLKETGKNYIPHITIKRWQRYEFDELQARIEAYPFKSQSFEVKQISLFKAEKDSKDQKYHLMRI